MINLNRKLFSQSMILLFIGWGILGSIMFFPVNLNGKHTCLSDRLLSYFSRSLEENSFHQREDTYPKYNVNNHLSGNHLILQKYILPYGICWWVFLGILGTGIYLFKTRYNRLRPQKVRKYLKSKVTTNKTGENYED